MSGTTREIFSRPEELRDHGLNVPQVTQVAHDLRDRDINVDRVPVTVEEGVEEIWRILSS
jgi:energy-coupling factor transport system ATP-binding protein